mgnify:CR=1 FL=1
MPPEPEQPPVTPLLNAGILFGRPLYRLDRDWTFTVERSEPSDPSSEASAKGEALAKDGPTNPLLPQP